MTDSKPCPECGGERFEEHALICRMGDEERNTWWKCRDCGYYRGHEEKVT